MANRVKEDQKNEKIIRSLLKIPENRRCINCNSVGPQYVCTNFSTFICTTCSGIHREFTHRVKSISMAKFTSMEVSALQGGGNASARVIYLKEWDPQRNSLPDGRNIERLRDFIKHVYVDRRFTGESNLEKPRSDKMGEAENINGNRRIDTYQGVSQSPPYDDSSERRYGDRSSSGGRSPEVVNDWRREDRFGNGRRSEDRSSTDGGSKLEGRSPDHLKDSDLSSPPIRPVRDILGESVSPLRVIEPPKNIGSKPMDASISPQRIASSSSLASSDANPSEINVQASFIDFDSIPEPPKAVSIPQTQQVATNASSLQPTASSTNDWANFDSVPGVKVTSASNSLESLLSELSIPTSASPSVPARTLSSGSSHGSSTTQPVLPATGLDSSTPQLTHIQPSLLSNVPQVGQLPGVQPQNSVLPESTGQSLSQAVTTSTAGYSSYKQWNYLPPNAHETSRATVLQVGQIDTNASMGTSFESTPSGRKALPEDLFSMNYSYGPSPFPGQFPRTLFAPPVPMQFNTQLAAWPVHNYPAVARSTNPFDVGHEPQPSQFPSTAYQSVLPKTASPGLVHTSSLGVPHPNHVPLYTSTGPQGSFVGQEIGGNVAARPQALSGFNTDASSSFASLSLNPQHAPHSTSSNFSSFSGNPFG